MSHPTLEKITSTFVEKGWGSEEVLFNNEELCGKILRFKKGAKFSMHSHKLKREAFWVMSGKLKVTGIRTLSARQYCIFLKTGDVLEVPRGAFHQIEAQEESALVEFSTHHDDEDSYRVLPGDSQKL